MSHSTKAISSKHQKQPKVQFQHYLLNDDEPDDISYVEVTSGQRAKHYDHPDKYYMVLRRQIRRNAQRLRTQYS